MPVVVGVLVVPLDHEAVVGELQSPRSGGVAFQSNHIANSDGSLKQELSYDACCVKQVFTGNSRVKTVVEPIPIRSNREGRLRNPATQAAYTPGNEPALFLGRGYTGHEHLAWFGLVNMNARLYDAALGRFLSPDPYVQEPWMTQNYNRYTYAMNNPLVYIDQDGEFWWWIAAAYFIFFTDAGYQLQKYFSPVAIHIDIRWGTHEKGIGFNVGAGVPKLFGYSKYWEYGKTYFWKGYGDYRGWETRKGQETTIAWFYTKGKTEYQSGEFSQTVGYHKIGIPGVVGIDVYNDLWGDKGDRFRTSRVRANFFIFHAENVLFTGDPGLNGDDRKKEQIETSCFPFFGDNRGKGTYVTNPKNPYADPDRYRHGVLSLRIGPVAIGVDAEWIRYFFQNVFIHNITNSPYFRYVKEKKTSLYFQFGGW